MIHQYDHLLLDGKNSVYRAIFAGFGDTRFMSSGADYFTILVKFVNNYVAKFKPRALHVMWDAPSHKVWRHATINESSISHVVKQYKQHRSSLYDRHELDVDAEVRRQIELSVRIMGFMGFRQYYYPHMEADDLIYAFCRVHPRDRILIVSSDGDLKQIAYTFENVDVYSPVSKHAKNHPQKAIENRPEYDITIHKALAGDKSDNIIGYYNVGKVHGERMARDPLEREAFINGPKAVVKNADDKTHVGRLLFELNRKIIDLSLCPDLLNIMMYIENRSLKPITFDVKKIEEFARKYKVRGLISDISRYVFPLKRLIRSESCVTS